MFKKYIFLPSVIAAVFSIFACDGGGVFDSVVKRNNGTYDPQQNISVTPEAAQVVPAEESPVAAYQTLDTSMLDAIAEMERSRGYMPGLGLRESLLREGSGDLAGAVIAAYKDLAWNYSFSNVRDTSRDKILITTDSIEDGIKKVKELYSKENKPDISESKRSEAQNAADAVIYFINGRYSEARSMLQVLFTGEEEPDAFSRWMILVCVLEQGGASRAEQSQYASIQARYGIFPAYWYFGARAFSGALSADYAERCINLYPDGPYAAECRGILAAYFGLSPLSGEVMLSRNEIERIISDSLRNGDPELLIPLIPLIAL
ncbi:MAG: hypothetical protein LBF80_01150, partial [Spirochaetaceae bacterium]|nr:hypothetical protein [Spirochaetaceae bacterium]